MLNSSSINPLGGSNGNSNGTANDYTGISVSANGLDGSTGGSGSGGSSNNGGASSASSWNMSQSNKIGGGTGGSHWSSMPNSMGLDNNASGSFLNSDGSLSGANSGGHHHLSNSISSAAAAAAAAASDPFGFAGLNNDALSKSTFYYSQFASGGIRGLTL